MAKKKNKRIPKNVYVRKNGTWDVVVTYTDLEGNRRTWKEVAPEKTAEYVKTRVKEMRLTLKALRHGNFPGEYETVGDFLSRWLKETASRRVGLRTLEDYTDLIDTYIIPGIGHIFIESLTAQTIKSFYASLEKRGKTWAVVKCHPVLRTALNDALFEGIIKSNPCQLVRVTRKRKKATVKAMPEEEARRFLKVARKEPRGLIFEFALETGMRPEEYLALKWTDIDFKRRTVTVQRALVKFRKKGGYAFSDTKTSSARRLIPFSKPVADRLKQHKDAQGKNPLDLVFPSITGSPLSPNNLARRDFKRILKAANLSEEYSPYCLRHTTASLLLRLGEHPKVVQERLGHSSINLTLDVYSHLVPTMQKTATTRLKKLLG